MNCSKTRSLIHAYLSASLAKNEMSEYECHITECKACSQDLFETSRMLRTLSSLAGSTVPADCWGPVRKRMPEATVALFRSVRLRRLILALSPTAAFAVFVILHLVAGVPNVREQVFQFPVVEHRQYMTAHAGAAYVSSFGDPELSFVSAQLEAVR